MALAASRTSADAKAWSPRPDPAARANDRAIAHLQEAICAIDSGDTLTRQRAVHQAIDAVTCLYLELGIEADGKASKSLADLFGYVVGRVLRTDIYDDTRFARQAMELLDVLYQSLRPAGPRKRGEVSPRTALADPQPGPAAAMFPLKTAQR